MLELRNIVKEYEAGDSKVTALRNVTLQFRKNEFVSVLGASGCGKTTLLNIIGGLDRYTSGDLIINGVSTKLFRDSDWDAYRNHSVGFVFQSYNLIPHQTVLANVELALTLSGVSKAERRARATEALAKVGLGDQLHKKPNQMSGGQMQRVAIARALVNNPDILLADEPTGALDTSTSVQIMELLKEVARDRLVIMVTHNPELAEEYSTRIVRLRDGELMDDSNPLTEAETAALAVAQESGKQPTEQKKRKRGKKTSMSFLTALSLSLNNLMTKKGRTVLTSFAGSIGIIGIALILSLSNGIQAYIDQVQEDTLSTYPLTIQKETQDLTAMMSAMTQVSDQEDYSDSDMIYVDDSLGTMMSAMTSTISNNLTSFKIYLDENYEKIADSVSDVQYTYDFDLQVYTEDAKTKIGLADMLKSIGGDFAGLSDMVESAGMSGMDVMSEMINNRALLDQQYDVIAGHWPQNANEVVLVVNSNNQISKMTLYMLGILDQSELPELMAELMKPGGTYEPEAIDPFTFDELLSLKFRLLNASEFYSESTRTYSVTDQNGTVTEYPVWEDIRVINTPENVETYIKEKGIELNVAGIIRPKAGATATSVTGAIGYTKALTDLILARNAESDILNQQKAVTTHNVLTGRPFEKTVYTKENIHELINTIDHATMETIYAAMTDEVKSVYEQNPPVQSAESFLGFVSFMSDDQLSMLLDAMIDVAAQTQPAGLSMLYASLNTETLTVDSKEDLLYVLPILSNEQVFGTVGGLMQLCGDQAMTGIYDQMNQIIMEMEVDENTFIILLQMMDEEQFAQAQETLYQMAPQTDATLESTLTVLGDAEKASPASINFYAKDFESKDTIEAFIQEYNDSVGESDKLQYTDVIGLMMSSVSTIINVISYVLIAFVSISLVVSSIMIGIITYISVLERTKEIGILRAIGASKSDISRVFNAETLIVGFAAGLIGVLGTVLLTVPINLIIHALSGIEGVRASLPIVAALILVAISMLLTFIAGLIPSGVASKKDPVVALRSE